MSRLLLCLLLVGCTNPDADPFGSRPNESIGVPTTAPVTAGDEPLLEVIHDDARGVTCYWHQRWVGVNKLAGLSCVPDSQLTLPQVEPAARGGEGVEGG